jgi:hypothetical protein
MEVTSIHTSTLEKSSWEEKQIHQKTTLKHWYKHLMTADYHEERTIILNENDSRAILWTWFTVGIMVFSTTFKNISAISLRSVLLVEKTSDLPQDTDKLYHIMLYRVHLVWSWFELTTLVGISTYWIGRYKPNFHTTMTKETHIFSMFQNAVIRNVAININRVDMPLVDNSVLKMYLLNSQLSLQIKSLTFVLFYFVMYMIKPFVGSIWLPLRLIWRCRIEMENVMY